MNRFEMMQQGTAYNIKAYINHTHNNLGIKNIERIFNKPSSRLILMINTREKLDDEVNAFIRKDKLILESVIEMELNRPYRMHHTGRDLHDDEMDISIIGFSEIDLKPGYRYQVQSCKLVNPNLVKVVLSSKETFGHAHRRFYN